jgi:hypothetical protein
MAMSDLVAFLLARMAEGEAVAREAGERVYVCDHCGVPTSPDGEWADGADHLPNHHSNWLPVHDPARVLAECEAKRRIVELHSADPVPQRMVYGTIVACSTCGDVDDNPTEWPCETLCLLALPYADHADYDEGWRP